MLQWQARVLASVEKGVLLVKETGERRGGRGQS